MALLVEDRATGEKTAAVYTRVSTGKQVEAGNLERQRLRLMEYAAVNGYRVVLQSSDVASGLNTRRRGAMRCGFFSWSIRIAWRAWDSHTWRRCLTRWAYTS